jgi:hypothetical protein
VLDDLVGSGEAQERNEMGGVSNWAARLQA